MRYTDQLLNKFTKLFEVQAVSAATVSGAAIDRRGEEYIQIVVPYKVATTGDCVFSFKLQHNSLTAAASFVDIAVPVSGGDFSTTGVSLGTVNTATAAQGIKEFSVKANAMHRYIRLVMTKDSGTTGQIVVAPLIMLGDGRSKPLA